MIQDILDDLFPDPPIPLNFSGPYTLLIAVLLSAQCTDARVNTITPLLPKTPSDMLTLTPQEIASIIRPCGLAPTKSKAIHTLSQILLEKHNGRVPSTFPELEALPGVGHKTASVVLAQAYDIPTFPVDTHIHRCAARWNLSDGTSVLKTEKDLKEVFPKSSWNKLHLQIIHYARAYCPARKHILANCPICLLSSSSG